MAISNMQNRLQVQYTRVSCSPLSSQLFLSEVIFLTYDILQINGYDQFQGHRQEDKGEERQRGRN